MSSNLLNKENSTANIFGARNYSKSSIFGNNGVKIGDGNLSTIANKIYCTPKMTHANESMCDTKEMTNTGSKSRKALGDLLNTTNKVNKPIQIGITPKADRIPSMNLFTPCSNTNNLKSKAKPSVGGVNTEMPNLAASALASNEMDSTEPVERFIGSKYDSFDDLFEEGRLTDFFLKNKVTFVGNLPNGCHVEADDRIKPVQIKENISVKQMNKIVKKQTKKMCKLTPHELPLLEEPSFTNILDMIQV